MKALYPVLELAHQRALEVVIPNSIAVDATVGNGYDTLFLAKAVGQGGLVYGFDIQEDALEATRQKLMQAGVGSHVRLFKESHHRIKEILPPALHGQVRTVFFNLGYLPGSDKTISTRADTTIKALEEALNILRSGGMISLVAYSGHAEGAREMEAVLKWLDQLPRMRTQVWRSPCPANRKNPPRLFLIYKGGLHTVLWRLLRRGFNRRRERESVDRTRRKLGFS